ncbi:Hypothetical predicted protein [Mytilus galloprovincialis]|uniref:Uncharacterized protein n=1 Tax=Mytilus galloprovincialis TaxID=29158 RepID=A0A8B6D7C0_MYTGA|nr:Hypothetical predicted protein [Mytilus galloprovincialis]
METEKKTQIFKIARERAPAMLKQFKLRKEHIKNQHILLLKNKREEKLRKENSKQQELQSLTKDIEKIGGLWVTSQDINKNLKKLNETEKMEAVKLQLKFRKKVLKCNPEDKFLLQFSANGIQFPLHELVSHLKVVLAADYTQTVPSNSIVSFVIKSKNERDEIMQKQREIVLKKIENIKLKKCIEANKVFKEPVPKRKKTVSVVENASKNTVENNSDIIMNVESSSQSFDHDMIMTGLNECPVGKNVVVAYMDTWYPGQVIAQENNIFKVKFLHPAKSVQNLFKWPEKEDISEIDEMFIFYLDFEILSKDSGGRTWYLTNYHKIQYEYEQYCRKYFD